MIMGCWGCWPRAVWLYTGVVTLRRLEGLPLSPWFWLFWDPQITQKEPQPCWAVAELARVAGRNLAKSANWQMTNWKASKGTEGTMGMLDTCRTQRCLVLINNLVCRSSKQWKEKETKPKPLKNRPGRDIKNKWGPPPPCPRKYLSREETHVTGLV